MKHFEPGDIVEIVYYPISYVIGRSAEVKSVHHPSAAALTAIDVTWYVLIDVAGGTRAAAHRWLRKMPPLWTPSNALEETSA